MARITWAIARLFGCVLEDLAWRVRLAHAARRHVCALPFRRFLDASSWQAPPNPGMVPALMHILLGICIALIAGAHPPAAKPSPQAQPSSTNGKLADLPIDFRCDNMVIKTEPNRNVCSGHVVLRRGTMLVCCDSFEGVADARWQWQRFVCTGDVRASRELETAWADKAEFFVADNDLVLTGRPVLHRGDSLLEGERVTMNIQEDYARVVKPRGRMGASREAPVGRRPVPMPTGTLPQACPIPPLGNR